MDEAKGLKLPYAYLVMGSHKQGLAIKLSYSSSEEPDQVYSWPCSSVLRYFEYLVGIQKCG